MTNSNMSCKAILVISAVLMGFVLMNISFVNSQDGGSENPIIVNSTIGNNTFPGTNITEPLPGNNTLINVTMPNDNSTVIVNNSTVSNSTTSNNNSTSGDNNPTYPPSGATTTQPGSPNNPGGVFGDKNNNDTNPTSGASHSEYSGSFIWFIGMGILLLFV
ncbi:hypothetical protein ABK040_002582 [Willaertia magna]